MQFANDAAGKKAMHALPPHRFVIHNLGGGDVRYLYAEPHHCVCIFIGTRDAYQRYRSIPESALYLKPTMSLPITRPKLAHCWRGTPSIYPAAPHTLPNISAITIK